MRLGTFFADELADLKFAQAVDDQRAHDQSYKQRGKTGKRSAEREVAKDAEGREVMEQLDEQQPVKQCASKSSRRSSVFSRSSSVVSQNNLRPMACTSLTANS